MDEVGISRRISLNLRSIQAVDIEPDPIYFGSMTIHLSPELERLIRQDIERGPYETVDEFVERAVQMLHDQEEWLSENRTHIAAKIEEGYAAAQRGELIDGDQVRAQLEERKREWRAKRGK
jgi:antitoxin ParD1/3/4